MQKGIPVFLLVFILLGCATRVKNYPYRPTLPPQEESLSQELRRIWGQGLKAAEGLGRKGFARTLGRLFPGGDPYQETAREELRQVGRERKESIRKLRKQQQYQ